MKYAAFLFTILFYLQVNGQKASLPSYAPGTVFARAEYGAQQNFDEEKSLGLQIHEVGVAFGQDVQSGNSANLYLEGRLGLRLDQHLCLIAYGLSNAWDFNIGGTPNQGNTNILSGSYGQKINLFDRIETEAYLGISYLNQKTENGNNESWGLPLTVVVDKPIFPSVSLGLIGQLQPTTKKGRAFIGLKISYDLNH